MKTENSTTQTSVAEVQKKSNESKLWQDELHVAIKACRLGREVLLKYFGNLERVEEKDQAGLVSEADKESEKVISDYLLRAFPQSEVLGEEGNYADGTKIEAAKPGVWRWILDPLDGTTNYVHRFPVFCISLGLEVDGELKLAVIDVPILGEVYTAIRGQGAYVNGRPMKVSSTEKLKDSLLSTGFFADDEKSLEEQLKIFSKLVRMCRGVRRPGAAAYDLAMVARGVFDAFWEKNLKPWDSAAGQLLVEEAGGIVKTYRGQDHNPYRNSIIAGNAKMVAEIHSEIGLMIRPETD